MQTTLVDIRRQAAEGLGELVELTSEDALKPFVVMITGVVGSPLAVSRDLPACGAAAGPCNRWAVVTASAGLIVRTTGWVGHVMLDQTGWGCLPIVMLTRSLVTGVLCSTAR